MKNPIVTAWWCRFSTTAWLVVLAVHSLLPAARAQSVRLEDYGNVTLHLAADNLVGLADGEPVANWPPLRASSATTNSKRPKFVAADAAFNGKPVVKFEGDGGYLKWDSAGCVARTIFAVVSLDGDADSLAGLVSNGNDRLNVRRNDATLFYRSAGRGMDANDFVGNAPSGVLSVNRVASGATTPGVPHLVMAVAGGQKTYDNLWVGNAQSTVARYWKGRVAEIIIYDGVLSEEGINRVGWYLQEKYSLATNFPAPVAQIQWTATAGGMTSSVGVLSTPGAPVGLGWNVSDTNTVSIDHGVLAATSQTSGSVTVSPQVTTTYTLTAANGLSTTNRTITIYIGQTPQPAVISEFLASNSGGLDDEDGDSSDWIEIHNSNPFAIDLAGYKIKDSNTAWTFPAGTFIEGSGYRIVFASSKNRTNPESNLHTGFGLSAGGEYLALVKPDGGIAVEFAPGFPKQKTNVSSGPVGGSLVYFPIPTPGEANGPAVAGAVEDVEFSAAHGFYESPVSLALTTATPGATIRYTLDGSTPSETNGTVYSTPLNIATTSTVRAGGFFPNYLGTATKTGSFLFLADIISGQTFPTTPPTGWPVGPVNGQVMRYGWNAALKGQYSTLALRDGLKQIPSISIVTDQPNLTDPAYGIYVNAQEKGSEWEQPASVEYLPSDNSTGFSIHAGLKIRGGYSRNDQFAKHSLRLQFRSRYGDSSLQFPLHGSGGTDEFETLDLRTEQNYHWANDGGTQNTAVREVFCRDLMAAMGQPATRSRYFHLYLNGQYWGIYQTEERAQEDYGASYFGGKADDYDVVQTSNHPDFTYELSSGSIDAWRTLWDLARAHQQNPTAANYFKIFGRNAAGARDEALPVYLDLDNLISYMLLHYYTGDGDAALSNFLGMNKANNWRGMRSRVNEDGFRFFVHDSEHTLQATSWVNDRANTNAPNGSNRGNFTYSNPEWIHEDLSANPEYRIRFADIVQKNVFNGGPLTSNVAQGTFDARTGQIDKAMVADLARWGTSATNHTTAQWQARLNSIRTGFFPSRPATLVSQLRTRGFFPAVNAPVFSQRGGQVAEGSAIALSAGVQSGTIYYTLDGRDPRAIGGGIAGNAYPAAGIPIHGQVKVRARFLGSGNVWSALDEADFSTISPAVAGKLVVSKVLYHPLDSNPAEVAAGFNGSSDFEYIELQNISSETLSLTGVTLADAVTFGFTSGSIHSLAPGAKVLVAGNAAGFAFRFGGGLPVAGSYSGSLNNSGETLQLLDASGAVILRFTYDDETPWPASADGDGPALVLIDPASNPDPDTVTNWRPSSSVGGTPGGTDGLDLATLRGQYFNPGDLSNPSKEATLWGNQADPDRDGWANLVEMAMGTSPTDPAAMPKLVLGWWTDPVTSQRHFTVSCKVREGLVGISIAAVASENLQGWLVNLAQPDPPQSHGDGSATLTFRDPTPFQESAGGHRFVRIKVSH